MNVQNRFILWTIWISQKRKFKNNWRSWATKTSQNTGFVNSSKVRLWNHPSHPHSPYCSSALFVACLGHLMFMVCIVIVGQYIENELSNDFFRKDWPHVLTHKGLQSLFVCLCNVRSRWPDSTWRMEKPDITHSDKLHRQRSDSLISAESSCLHQRERSGHLPHCGMMITTLSKSMSAV